MYSTDGGKTFQWFTTTDANGQAVARDGGGLALAAFDDVIAKASSQ
jgi:hypothetical protein